MPGVFEQAGYDAIATLYRVTPVKDHARELMGNSVGGNYGPALDYHRKTEERQRHLRLLSNPDDPANQKDDYRTNIIDAASLFSQDNVYKVA